MQLLFLFFTQSEGGAPGYLSRKGEEAAQVLTDSLSQFLSESLEINLNENFESRAKSLNEDLHWRQLQKSTDLAAALKAATILSPHVVLVSGATPRSLKTAERLATQLALPVCIAEGVDIAQDNKPQRETLKSSLPNLLNALRACDPAPKILLLGTSLPALEEWLLPQLPSEKASDLKEVFKNSTQAGNFPTVFAAGMHLAQDGSTQWTFDV